MAHNGKRDWDFLSKRLKSHASGQQLKLPTEETLFNRELSWLAFNDRVLNEAADGGVPPLERLRFATIVSSNLDEFFRVRIAEIARVARRNPNKRWPDGLSAAQLYTRVREHVIRQKAHQARVLREIFQQLRLNRIHVHAEFGRVRQMDREILELLPEIDIAHRRSNQSLPELASERIHVLFRFAGEIAIATIKDREQRLLELPRKGSSHYVLVDRWLAARASMLFADRKIIEAFPFKVIREADLRYRPDEEDNLEDQIVRAVRKRSQARIVRLEVDAPTYSEGTLSLASSLRLDSAALYRFDLPLDLRTLALIYKNTLNNRLKYPAVHPRMPIPVRRARRTIHLISRCDFLLHHPYDSLDPVVNIIQQAARDPKVTRIYHTVYRTTSKAPTLEALKEAVQRGKEVTAYVEIRARFDELNNVFWSAQLRRAGVKVLQPPGGLKVHSKVTQFFRRENGVERSYLHLGTGNYHPATAKQYTDLSLLTADPVLGADIAKFFRALSRRRKPDGFEELLVAPVNLHAGFVRLIREETEIAKAGGRGRIKAKMNSLVDRDIIEALYEASRAGVKIDLIVRGICCLLPGIEGLSENIRVLSIIDRFLEHSRIYYFRAGGKRKVYLSSADWMPRNFFTRYELAFPVKDRELKKYIHDVVLGYGLQDNVKAWRMEADGTYARPPAPPAHREFRSQFMFEDLARREYAGTVLFNRVPVLR